MPPLKTPALCLRAGDFSETSQVASFLTPDYGRLNALAKGARRPKNSTGGPFFAPALWEIVVFRKEDRDLDILAESRLKEDFPGLRTDLEKIYAAWYVVELVLLGSRPQQAAAELFAATAEVLRRIEKLRDFAAARLAYEGRYLEILGFRPEIEACAACRGLAGAGTGAAYSLRQGGVLCPSCAAAGGVAGRISARALGALRLLMKTGRPEGVVLDGKSRREIARFLGSFIVFSLEKKPAMLKYVTPAGAAEGPGGGTTPGERRSP